MNEKPKLRPDSIEQAHRALDALPEHRPEEFTKTQAIRQLIVPIRATQSKGYSLAAIGKVLSECGIPIITGALRAYVSEASAAGGKKKKRPAKPAVQAPEGAQAGIRKSNQKDLTGAAHSRRGEAQRRRRKTFGRPRRGLHFAIRQGDIVDRAARVFSRRPGHQRHMSGAMARHAEVAGNATLTANVRSGPAFPKQGPRERKEAR